MQYFIIFGVLYVISIIITIIILNKQNDRILEVKLHSIEREYIQKHKQKLETLAHREIEELLKNRDDVEADLKARIEAYNQLQDAYGKLNGQMENLRSIISVYEADQKARIDQMMIGYAEEQKKKSLADHEELMKTLGAQAMQMSEQIQTLSNEIEAYSAKQAAINEAILRQRAIDEQQDFYRVCLAPEAANDVEVLNAARKNLKKPEIIDKIIYDNYVSKPVLEMVKRVLQNTTCSGIYKITCLKTGEIYIGKSTDIKNRWQQHCKTVFNCGTIASSLLHTKMKQYGIDNFTFELVEQVPKDQLSEREKFYINFYQTKEVGLNERNG